MNLVPKFVDEALSPPAQSVGNTLSNVWDLTIGNHFNYWIQKQGIRQQGNLKQYKNAIEQKTQKIPQKNLKEPDLSIVGPALEASKYYIDSEELRNMFANLVASSIDNRKSVNAHPSFVEIIKQLSPLDAKNLELYKNNKSLPICEYRLTMSKNGNGYQTAHTNVFLENDEINNLYLISSSMENLSRLRLINIDYGQYLIQENYDKFENTVWYRDLQDFVETISTEHDKVEIKKGVSNITPFGSDFINICLS